MASNDPPSRTQLLQSAMLASFTGKAFEDVKFFAFSRRMRGGRVDKPKSLVANSSLVRKTTSHFDPVLSGGFSESDLIDMDAPHPSTLRQNVDDYGYTSDSDLESENEEDLNDSSDATDRTPSGIFQTGILEVLEYATASVRSTLKPECRESTTFGIPNAGPTLPELHKIVGDVIGQLQHLSDEYMAKAHSPTSSIEGSTPTERRDIGRPRRNGDVTPTGDVATRIPIAASGDVSIDSRLKRRGRVIYLHDIAFKTWRAFLFYAYFEELSFAPLKSLKSSRVRTDTHDPYGPPLCSPKSMYRLAEKYDIPDLKKLAMDDIRTQLSLSNILEELFSSFTTLHPEIQELELDYLYDNIDSLSIQRGLPEWIEAMEDGRLSKGASRTLSHLFTRLAGGSVARRPQNQSNFGLPGHRQQRPLRPECYGPHRSRRVIHIEPDGAQVCDYCGGEVRAS